MMKLFKGIWITAALMCALLYGCDNRADAKTPADVGMPQAAAPASEAVPSPTASPVPSPTAAPTPTPEPTPAVAVIGAVGDLMFMAPQIVGAYDEAADAYDFSRSFVGVAPMMRSMDLMCGNFESTLAGKEAGYSKKRADDEPAETFNTPDEVVDTLKDIGLDFLSTANNHSVDRNYDGLIRTLDVLDEKGVYHTGTARSDAERDTPLIIEVNGMKLGFISATYGINKRDRYLNDAQESYAVNRLYQDEERLLLNIRQLKEAGAEFIIAYPHWDKEKKNHSNAASQACARLLLENGVDCILGSHPHVVQEIEYVTVERDGQPYTGLVVYSMGNFISHMFPSPINYGMFVQLTLERAADGTVVLKEACYMPTYYFYRSIDKKYVHQVVPALSDPTLIQSYSELDESDYAKIAAAREHVLSVCGDVIPVMEDQCWIN